LALNPLEDAMALTLFPVCIPPPHIAPTIIV